MAQVWPSASRLGVLGLKVDDIDEVEIVEVVNFTKLVYTAVAGCKEINDAT